MGETKEEFNKLGHNGERFTLDGVELKGIQEFWYESEEEDGGIGLLKLTQYVEDSEIFKEDGYEEEID